MSSSSTSPEVSSGGITIRIIEKPKRPLSAYNLFFKSERQKLLEEKNRLLARPSYDGRKIGFANLAKTVSLKWKSIDADEKRKFQELAKEEQVRYRKSILEWKRKKRCLERGESIDELSSTTTTIFTNQQSLGMAMLNGSITATATYLGEHKSRDNSPTTTTTSTQQQQHQDDQPERMVSMEELEEQAQSSSGSHDSHADLYIPCSPIAFPCLPPDDDFWMKNDSHNDQPQQQSLPTTDSLRALMKQSRREAADKRLLQRENLEALAQRLDDKDALDCFIDLFLQKR